MPGDVWVIAGLGNPGPTYAGTRHNAGYLVVDELLERSGAKLRQHKSGRALTAEARLNGPTGQRAVLMRGHGYMNESGRTGIRCPQLLQGAAGSAGRHPRRARHPVRRAAREVRRRRQRAQRAAVGTAVAGYRRLLPGPVRNRSTARDDKTVPTSSCDPSVRSRGASSTCTSSGRPTASSLCWTKAWSRLRTPTTADDVGLGLEKHSVGRRLGRRMGFHRLFDRLGTYVTPRTRAYSA